MTIKDLAKFLSNNLVSVRGMQIFRVGTWNGKNFTQEDLDTMVSNFNELIGQIVPKVKITHRDDQESLAGLASYGDMVRMFREGDGLYADFERMPSEVADWVRTGRFAERSVEMYPSMTINGKRYEKIITAVSLLGHEIPAVAGMEPVKLSSEDNKVTNKEIMAVNFSYAGESSSFTIVKDRGGEKDMDIAQLMTKIDEMGKTIASFMKKQQDAEFEMAKSADAKALEGLKAQVAEYKAKVAELETLRGDFQKVKDALEKSQDATKAAQFKAKEVEVDSFISGLKTEGKLLPAQEAETKALLMAASMDVKVGKFKVEKDGKTEEVELTAFEALKNTFSKMPKSVNFKEVSGGSHGKNSEAEAGSFGKDKYSMPNGDDFNVCGADLDAEAKKYMQERKVSYAEAVVAVSIKFKNENKAQGLPSDEE